MAKINLPTPQNSFFTSRDKLIFLMILLTAILFLLELSLIFRSQSNPQILIQPTILPTPSINISQNDQQSTDTNEWKTFTNKSYNYKIDYPKELTLIDGVCGVFIEKGSSNLLEILTLEKDIYIEEGKSLPFKEYAFELAKMSCSADSPWHSQYCDSIVKELPYTNPYGIRGYEFFLNKVDVDRRSENQSNSTLGPNFVLDVDGYTTGKIKFLFFITYKTVRPQDAELIRQIVNSLRF